MLLRTQLTFALLAVLAVPSAAQEKIKLKNGSIVAGRATAYDAKNEVLSFRTEDGQDKKYTMAELDGRSVYLVYSSVIPKENAKGQLQLANFARDAGLYRHAIRRYGYAEQDPSLKSQVESERVILRRRASAYCMEQAKAAQAKGDSKEAQKWLSLILEKLPNETEATEAAAMVQANYMRDANARDDALEKEHVELLQTDLKKGKQAYDTMIERTRDGLTARNESQSQNLWKNALSEGQTVLKEIDRLTKKYPEDPKVQDGAKKYRKLTIDQMVEVHMHLASLYTTRSSFNEALREVNQALALSPQDPEVLSQRARIEAASNEGLINF